MILLVQRDLDCSVHSPVEGTLAAPKLCLMHSSCPSKPSLKVCRSSLGTLSMGRWGTAGSSPELPLRCVLLSPQVQLDNLPGMSLMAGKALSSARMSDAVLSQSSLMASQQLRDRDGEGERWGCPRGTGGIWAAPRGAESQREVLSRLFALTECGESLEGQEHPNLGDGSQHLNTSCYPSTCITDVLLSYKHPEVPFGMEQAGV